MNPKLIQPWIQLERIEPFIRLEPAFVILGLAISSVLVYKLLLADISAERHKNMREMFRNLGLHILGWIAALIAYELFHHSDVEPANVATFDRLSAYLGLITLIWGAVVVVKTSRILAFEYLFLGSMRIGVPVLLVNIFTLLLSIVLGGSIITEIFNIRLAPLLATSAIFSLVLGLALQDTLGNLFAGVALQFDKPYEIGDWIEIQSGGQTWVGQVHEISWRATVLIGLNDEPITLPNRIVSQAQISNYAAKDRPIIRSQIFKIPYGSASIPLIKELLIQSIRGVEGIRSDPAPLVHITEASESWIACKLIYFIDDYGMQYSLRDQIVSAVIEKLEHAGIPLAANRLWIEKCAPSLSSQQA